MGLLYITIFPVYVQVNRAATIPELSIMFENCSASARPSVLSLAHVSSRSKTKSKDEEDSKGQTIRIWLNYW